MEKDQLKTLWQTMPSAQKSRLELAEMLKEKSHPILKSIKKQIIIELLVFTVLLFCYYTMFDGGRKSFLINAIMVIAIAMPILLNLKGYQLQRKIKSSQNLKIDLTNFIGKLKNFTAKTILTRIIFIAGMAIFFTYDIPFSPGKWWIILYIIFVLTLQLLLLYNVLSKRIKKLKLILKQFDT